MVYFKEHNSTVNITYCFSLLHELRDQTKTSKEDSLVEYFAGIEILIRRHNTQTEINNDYKN